MERSETILHLPFPISYPSSKETSEVSSVPTDYLLSLLGFGALLLLCLLQAGQPMDAGRCRAHLGRPPQSPSCSPVLRPPHGSVPAGSCPWPSPILGDILRLGRGKRKAGRVGHGSPQGLARAAAASHRPRKRPALCLLPAAPGPID